MGVLRHPKFLGRYTQKCVLGSLGFLVLTCKKKNSTSRKGCDADGYTPDCGVEGPHLSLGGRDSAERGSD